MKAKQEKKKTLFIELAIISLILFNLASAQENPFNLEVHIADAHKGMQAGEDLLFTTKILNLAGQQRMDITLNYNILDSQKNTLTSKSETLAIETQASFVGNIKIPENTPEGDYELDVQLIVNNKEEAKGKDSFEIIKKESKTPIKITITLLIIASLIILIFITLILRRLIEKLKIKLKIHEIVKKRVRN